MTTYTRICTRIPEGGTGHWVDRQLVPNELFTGVVNTMLDTLELDIRSSGLEPSQINLGVQMSASALVHSSTAECAVADDEAPR